MRGLAAIALMTVSLLSPAVVFGQDAQIDPIETPKMFVEAALGYCAARVHGRPVVNSVLDPAGPGWVDLRPDAQTTGGQVVFAGRVNTSTGIIVDLNPAGTSCFVQINLAAPVFELTQNVRQKIEALPGSVLLDELETPEGHSTIYGLIDPDDTSIPIFSVNDSGATGSVATVIVAVGTKGN